MIKRMLDIFASGTGLILLSPLMVLTAFLIKVDSPGPVFFKQERVGKGFRPFLIYKFRTMIEDAPRKGTAITIGNDPRITRIGRLLRRTKFDELPQLINVLKGDMSLVGPRPEVPRYVEMFRQEYAEILRIRPGITDMASLKFRDEATVLGRFENPEEKYVTDVLPEKIKLAKEYARQSSLFFDLGVIFKTLVKLIQCRSRRSIP